MVNTALEVSLMLEERGIYPTVINARFIKPLDKNTILGKIRTSKAVVTLEDNVLIAGFGSSVLELINSEGMKDIRVKNYGFPDKFIEHGTIDEIFKRYKLDAESIFIDLVSFLNKE